MPGRKKKSGEVPKSRASPEKLNFPLNVVLGPSLVLLFLLFSRVSPFFRFKFSFSSSLLSSFFLLFPRDCKRSQLTSPLARTVRRVGELGRTNPPGLPVRPSTRLQHPLRRLPQPFPLRNILASLATHNPSIQFLPSSLEVTPTVLGDRQVSQLSSLVWTAFTGGDIAQVTTLGTAQSPRKIEIFTVRPSPEPPSPRRYTSIPRAVASTLAWMSRPL